DRRGWPTAASYRPSLHPAGPISVEEKRSSKRQTWPSRATVRSLPTSTSRVASAKTCGCADAQPGIANAMTRAAMPIATDSFEFRSEEHTPELQSRENLVCRHLLE